MKCIEVNEVEEDDAENRRASRQNKAMKLNRVDK